MFVFSAEMMRKLFIISILSISSYGAMANELQNAIHKSDEELIRGLIDNGGFKDKLNEYLPHWEQTPLYTALQYGHLNIAKLLLEKGADINAKNRYEKESSLHLATREKKEDLLEFLLSHKADPNINDRNGKTALHFAAMNDDLKAARSLVEAGAKGNILDGEESLWYYYPRGTKDERKYAIDYVADQKGPLYRLLLTKRFPLHYAVLKGDRSLSGKGIIGG